MIKDQKCGISEFLIDDRLLRIRIKFISRCTRPAIHNDSFFQFAGGRPVGPVHFLFPCQMRVSDEFGMQVIQIIIDDSIQQIIGLFR